MKPTTNWTNSVKRNLCRMVSEGCFGMVPRAKDRTLPLAIRPVRLTDKRWCYCQTPGTAGTIRFLHLDIAQCRLNALDSSSAHPAIHNHIAATCMTGNKRKQSRITTYSNCGFSQFELTFGIADINVLVNCNRLPWMSGLTISFKMISMTTAMPW